MATSNLEFLITAKDEASGKLKSIADMGQKIGAAMTVAGGVITGALALTVKAAAEAEQKMASVDATLNAMKGTSIQVATGLTATVTKLKVTGTEALGMKNAMDSANLSIQAQQMHLTDLQKKLSAHKITQAEYNLQVAQTKNNIEALNIKMSEYGGKLGGVTISHVALTKTVKITAETLEKARVAIVAASHAATNLGFDDEEAALSMVKFYQRTGNLTETLKLNNIAMDLARAKHIDLTTASTLVGQVLSGNGKVLKQYGIDIKDSATPLQALGELSDKVKGQAAAFADTLEGKTEILKNKFGDLQETIGEKLIPIITDLLDKYIIPLINKVQEWADAHPELTEKIVLVTAAVGGLMLVLGPLLVALPAITAAFALLSPVVLTVIGIIVALGVTVSNIVQIVILLRDHWKEVWLGIKEYTKEAVQWIMDYIQPLIGTLESLYDKLTKVYSATKGAITSTASGAWSEIKYLAGARAGGGSVMGNSSYLVGENGPEVFTPYSSGFVTPNSALGGGGNININISGAVFTQDAARSMAEIIMDDLRRISKIGL